MLNPVTRFPSSVSLAMVGEKADGPAAHCNSGKEGQANLRGRPQDEGAQQADQRRRDEAEEQEPLEAESAHENRDRNGANDVSEGESPGEDAEDSLVEMEIGEIEVEEEEEEPESEVVQECGSKECPDSRG